MRRQFVKTMESVMESDPRVVTLLGDIGVFGFRNVFREYPNRIYNVGILEQATIGFAAGLALTDYIPVVHTIAPFLVERAYEQLKTDFCYQGVGGNFVGVGASYDYSALGPTHQAPGDVGVLKQLPGMEIVIPGTSAEFHTLFNQAYADGHPTYFRLSERENSASQNVEFGQGLTIKDGKQATILAIGPMLEGVLAACADMDVTILYYTTVEPFDKKTLRENFAGGKVVVVEPYYSGPVLRDVVSALQGESVRFECIGMPMEFTAAYGHPEDHDAAFGLDQGSLREKIARFVYE